MRYAGTRRSETNPFRSHSFSRELEKRVVPAEAVRESKCQPIKGTRIAVVAGE